MGEHRIEGKVGHQRADTFRENVEPNPVTKDHVKERLQYLADLIQEYRGLKGEPRIVQSEMGTEIRKVMEQQLVGVWGTSLVRVEGAIRMYVDSVEHVRREKFVADGLTELFGARLREPGFEG